jgi:hypothetical protein
MLSYDRYNNPGGEAGPSRSAPPEEATPSAGLADGQGPSLAESPIGELLCGAAPRADIGACEQTRDLLELLRKLEAMNR